MWTGDQMHEASKQFADEPLSEEKRSVVARAARTLLSSVTRLLIVADMLDVQRLLKCLQLVQADLDRLHTQCKSEAELANAYSAYDLHMTQMVELAGCRQNDLLNAQLRDQVACARGVLLRRSPLFYTAIKTGIAYPDLPQARENCDVFHAQLANSVKEIALAIRATSSSSGTLPEKGGDLAAAIDAFERFIHTTEPMHYVEPQVFSFLHTFL